MWYMFDLNIVLYEFKFNAAGFYFFYILHYYNYYFIVIVTGRKKFYLFVGNMSYVIGIL